MFGLFKKPEPLKVENVGTFKFEGSYWSTEILLNQKPIELWVDGDKKGLDTFALNYWSRIDGSVQTYWHDAIEFTLAELHKLKETRFTAKDFVLSSVSIHREKSFDKGHLSLWFEITGDENGSHYVSFIDETPNYWHRDG